MGPLGVSKRGLLTPLAVLVAWLALASPAAAAPSVSEPPALGTRDMQPTWDDNVAGMAEAFSFKATADGPVDVVNVFLERHWDRRKVGNPGARLIAGIYADANGEPGALLGQGSLTSFRYRAWNTVPISPIELEKGKTYYITMLGLRDDFVYRTNGGGLGTSPSFTSPRGQTGLLQTWKSDNRRFPKDSPIMAYAAERYSVLVFTKNATAGATEGAAALRSLADASEVIFDVTDDASKFTESNLAKYRAVVFLNTSGDVLDDEQQAVFEDY
jgi:Trehalose utilisation